MPDELRVYSDEEFALILRKAAELGSVSEAAPHTSSGLTLSEIKYAAAQVGIDPALVERAARTLSSTTPASALERTVGGQVRHAHEARFSIQLDEQTAAHLLSAVRIGAGLAGSRDVGHSSALGMTWHDGGELESLRVTARADGDGTAVTVSLDRRGTLTIVGMFSAIAMFLTVLFSVFGLYPEAPVLGVAGLTLGTGGILAAARGYWASSTRRVRQRIGEVMDVIARTLTPPDAQTSTFKQLSDGASEPDRPANAATNPELTET